MKAKALRRTLSGLAGCLLLFCNTQSRSDTLLLVNGDRISGHLLRLDHAQCIFDTEFQNGITIPFHRIAGLTTNHTVILELKSGERINGLVNMEFKAHQLNVRSERFGSIQLTTDDFETLSSLADDPRLTEQIDETTLASLHGKGSETQTPATETPDTSETESAEKVGAEQAEQQEEDQVQQVFLRASGVLLEPGDIQAEVGMNYVREEQTFFLTNRGSTNILQSRARTFLFPLIGRFGLLPGLEGFLNVPFQYQERDGTTVDQTSLFSLGDVRAGLKYVLHREDSLPEIIGIFDFRAPTGRVRNPLLATAAVTGTGQWAAAGGVNLIKSFDPVVLFGGLRYEYNIFNHTIGTTFGSWSNLGYNMGLGFAVNNRVTLIGQFQGNYFSERNIGAGVVPDRELATLRGGFTYKLASKQYIEPSITFGINDVSPDLVIGLSYNWRI